jgi:hypothetical protein
MAASAITIYKGNPYAGTMTVTDSAENVYDLTGKIVFFTVKNFDDEDSDDADALITKDITSHTNPTAGITVLELTASQTNIAKGDYKYDLRIYQASPLVQLNSVQGLLTVKEIVTKRTS